MTAIMPRVITTQTGVAGFSALAPPATGHRQHARGGVFRDPNR